MTPPSPRLRVAAYVIRRGPPSALLVFDHAGTPEAGTQVPAGGIRAGEPPEWAVGRETAEERADGRRGPAPRGGGEAAPRHGPPPPDRLLPPPSPGRGTGRLAPPGRGR
nr:NUDIX domain-containing protein [Streptomyces sp. SCA2-2]